MAVALLVVHVAVVEDLIYFSAKIMIYRRSRHKYSYRERLL